ncbi:hypothetical protein WT01_22955 [Burkholderia cepacia]|uniref:Uncharacterized protein n=1 Tax=Burkholderia cepacia TaxID=292 RepID=A0A124RTY6_BURCE|nr:hypothetical protein WS88_20575 [Burkholderia cepacia]KVK84616.1 hypothetical protein WS90_11590 [Burkholderia cepacia]KVL56539.1 hypothetical protein WT01_22955 [Burkholderia cepacia]
MASSGARIASSVNPAQMAARHQSIDRRAHLPGDPPLVEYPATPQASAPMPFHIQLEAAPCSLVGKSHAR